jgi:hypothetical protein
MTRLYEDVGDRQIWRRGGDINPGSLQVGSRLGATGILRLINRLRDYAKRPMFRHHPGTCVIPRISSISSTLNSRPATNRRQMKRSTDTETTSEKTPSSMFYDEG